MPLQGTLKIAGARLEDRGRTLILATDPHPRAARYQLPLSVPNDYDLTGIEATWSPDEQDQGGEPAWIGWWPDLNLEVTRRLTHGAIPQEKGLALLSKPGRLVVTTQVRLPRGEARLRIEANGPIRDAMLGDAEPAAVNEAQPSGDGFAEFWITSSGEPQFLTFTVETGKNGHPLEVRVRYATAKSTPFRLLERNRQFVPWAPIAGQPSASIAPVTVPNLSGGDPVRGEALFFSDLGRCSQCHAFGGKGGKIGPDLTEISRKGKAEIYRSIAAPSAVIEPDFVAYTVASRDGKVFVGIVRAEGPDAIRITDTNARSTLLRRSEIDQIRPSATSIMPVGLAAALGDSRLRDLLSYLAPGPPLSPAGPRSK